MFHDSISSSVSASKAKGKPLGVIANELVLSLWMDETIAPDADELPPMVPHLYIHGKVSEL
jgi:hypothetical protein